MADRNSAPNALLVAGCAAFFLVLSLSASLTPRGGEDVAVLLPFDKSAAMNAAIVRRSGGAFVSAALQGRILIVRSDDPQFMSRLYANGAMFVFNPRLVVGCKG